MRAAVISELGRPPELADRPEPSGEAIYEVSAVSLNPIDVNVGAGRYFGGHPELPYIPGCEGVGRASDGTRVYLFGDGLGLSRDGLLAERAVAPADLGIPLPDGGLRRDRGVVRHRRDGGLDARRVARARAEGRSRARARRDRHGRARRRAGGKAARRRARRGGRPQSRAARSAPPSSAPTRPSASTRTTSPQPSRRRPAAAAHLHRRHAVGAPGGRRDAGRRARLAPGADRPVRRRGSDACLRGDPRQDGRDLRLHRLRRACEGVPRALPAPGRPRRRGRDRLRPRRPTRSTASPRPGSGRPTVRTQRSS